MRRGSGILLLAAVTLATARCGQGAADQRAAIEKAVRNYVFSSGCCELTTVSVERITISRLDNDYATALVDGFSGPSTPAGALTAVLGDAGTGGWVVLGLGTTSGSLGCTVPVTVARELRLSCGAPA
ncbi:MAG: hypothetical protein ACXVZP_00230 [Gaiellaceae bacterium]